MIVPGSRLIALTLALFPVAVAAAFIPGGAGLVGAAAVLAALLAGWDLVSGWRRRGTVRAELPEVVRLIRRRDCVVPLLVKGDPRRTEVVRLAIAWPEELGVEVEEQAFVWRGGKEPGRLEWRCFPSARGKWVVDRVFVETVSPLKLWGIRAYSTSLCELRVYPNIDRDRKSVAAFFLNRGMFGAHAHRQVGRGREFERLREYLPGDSFDEIYWKGTARRAAPITKVFQIERTQEVYIVLDASRLSARVPAMTGEAPARDTILERFVNAALILALAAEQQGDRFGLVTFGARVENFLRAGGGHVHFNACRDLLYTLAPENESPDFRETITFLKARLRKRALLFFLTSVDDPVLEEQLLETVGLVGRRHLVLVNALQPEGVGPLFARHDEQRDIDLHAKLAGHLRWCELMETGKKLKSQGVRFSLLENERLAADLVSQYMQVKQRQLL